MSIIIRLQNLPWSANSSDIRNFFGGLVIPEGGVHIIGGETGDAFIAFHNDEDARIAMQNNGSRLKDNRVRLFLSSRAEMLQLIEQVREGYTGEPVRELGYHSNDHLKLSEQQMSGRLHSPERLRRRSPEQTRHSPRRTVRSRSSSRHRDGTRDSDRHRYSHRSSRPGDEHRLSPVRHSQGRRSSIDRYMEKSAEFLRETGHVSRLSPKRSDPPEVRFVDSTPLYNQHSPMEHPSVPPVSNPSISSAENLDMFAKYIASKIIRGEPLCDKSAVAETAKNDYPMDTFENPSSFPGNIYKSDNFVPADSKRNFPEAPSESVWHRDLASSQKFPPDNFSDSRFLERGGNISERQFQGGFQMEDSFNRLPSQFGSTSNRGLHDNVQTTQNVMKPMFMAESFCETQPNYCVRLVGLSPNANFKTVQSILKGIYAPQHNIKWDVNIRGHKNGIAYVKMSNKEDFYNVLDMRELDFEGKPVCLEKCPDEIFYDLFGVKSKIARYGKGKRHNQEYCYMLKGLPYVTTENDIMNFFTGLNLVDLLILYDNNGKATGTGYVQFGSSADYIAAFERNGKKIGHRYIELFPSNRADIDDARNTAAGVSKPIGDILNEHMFKNRILSYKQNALQKRPLCVVLSGLPSTIKTSDIFGFFNSCGIRPDAVHNILNEINSCSSGRAFVEFFDLFDLDVALKQHGKYIGENMVSVKQVLFEEMMRILDTQPVQHDYGIIQKQNEEVDSGPVPEKLPYIWEPPDTKEDVRATSSQQFSWKNLNQRSDFSRESPISHSSGRVGISKTFNDMSTFNRSDHLRNEIGNSGKPNVFESHWLSKGSSDRSISVSKGPYSDFGMRSDYDAGVGRDLGNPFYEAQSMIHSNVKPNMDFERSPHVRKDYGSSGVFDQHQTKEFSDGMPFRNQEQNVRGEDPHMFSRESFGQRSDPQRFSEKDAFGNQERRVDYTDSCNTRDFSPYGIRRKETEQLRFDSRESFSYPEDRVSNAESSRFASEEVYRKPDQYEKEQFADRGDSRFDSKKSYSNRDSHEDQSRSFKNSGAHDDYSASFHLNAREQFDYYDGSREKSKFSSQKSFAQRRSNNDGAPSRQAKESILFHSNKDEGIMSGASLADDKSRVPVKFGVKARQTVETSEKVKDTFGPEASREEAKRQLKKLSPEKQEGDKITSGKQTSSKSYPIVEKKQSESKPKERCFEESANKDQSSSRKSQPVASGNLKDNKNQKDQSEKSKSDKKNSSSSDRKDLSNNERKPLFSADKKTSNDDKKSPNNSQRKSMNDDKKATNNDKKASNVNDRKATNDDKKGSNVNDRKATDDDKKGSNVNDRKASNDDKKASNGNDRKASNDDKKASNGNDRKASNDGKKAANEDNQKSTNNSDKGREKQAVRGKAADSSTHRRRRPWSPPRRAQDNYNEFHRDKVRKMDIYQDQGYGFPYSQVQAVNQGYFASSMPFSSDGCTVQASDVPPYVGLDELLYFFRGFRLRGQDIIRRFTDTGEPTGDLRITFESPLEARRAVNLLHKRPLAGVPVILFCV